MAYQTLARGRPRAGSAGLYLFNECGWDFTPDVVAEHLRVAAGGPVTVVINSGGGDCFAGLAIFEMLRAYRGAVEVQIVGLAASAASVIAAAGDIVGVAPSSMMMVHEASMMIAGDERDLLAGAGLLGKVSGMLAEIYAARAGGSAAEWRDRMKAETWFTSSEAVAAGLADRVLDVVETVSAGLTGAVLAAHRPSRAPRRPRPAPPVNALMREGMREGMPGRAVCGVVLARAGAPARRVFGRRSAPSVAGLLRELSRVRR